MIRENSILSFRRAALLGAEYVELDVQLTVDHVPIIYHDFEIDLPIEGGEDPVKVLLSTLTLEQFKDIANAKVGE